MCVYLKSDMNFATFGILYWRVPFFNVQPALVYFIWLFGRVESALFIPDV